MATPLVATLCYPDKDTSVINMTEGTRGSERNAVTGVVVRQPPREISQNNLVQEDRNLETAVQVQLSQQAKL